MSYNLERTLNCVLISRDIENEKTICLTQTSENKMNHCYMKWTVCIARAKYKTSTNSQELCFYLSLSPVRLSIYGRKKDKLNGWRAFFVSTPEHSLFTNFEMAQKRQTNDERR